MDVKVRGEYAYVADRSRLKVISISDPENPEQIGEFEIDGETYGIDVLENNLYLANHPS